MINALDKRALGAKKGGIERSISNLQKAGKPVPKGKHDELNAVSVRTTKYVSLLLFFRLRPYFEWVAG